MTVVAFTTARADRPLYRRDVLNAIAYPDGWLLNLTYRGQWLDETTRKAIGSRELKGRAILIVLCGEPALSPGDEFQKVVPLRLGKIIEATGSGDLNADGIASLRLELDGFPADQLSDCFSGGPTGGPLRIPRPSGRDSLFLQTHDGLAPEPASAVEWDRRVKRLKTIPEIADCYHFRMVRLVQREATFEVTKQPCRVQDQRLDINLFQLTGGRLYDLEFYVDASSLSATNDRPVELALEGDQLAIAEPVVKQHGSGATVSFLLAAKKQYASELVTVVARSPRPKSAGPPPAAPVKPGPQIQMVFRVGPGRRFWLGVVLIVTLGTLALNVDHELLTELSVGHPHTWSLVIKTAGSLVLALGGWFAFRRLPVKI